MIILVHLRVTQRIQNYPVKNEDNDLRINRKNYPI
jgi:hypothetical protein